MRSLTSCWSSRNISTRADGFSSDLHRYRGSPLSTNFGTWKKSYYAKFVLVESIFTSTNFHQSPPLVRTLLIRMFNKEPQLFDYDALHCTCFYAPSSVHKVATVFIKSYYNFINMSKTSYDNSLTIFFFLEQGC